VTIRAQPAVEDLDHRVQEEHGDERDGDRGTRDRGRA
jgi:hypothetical protein